MEDLIRLDNTPISNEAFIQNIGIEPDDIIKYAELSKYNTIEELLPNNGDFKIVFLEWEKNKTGHWVALMKLKDKYEYFNSFGVAYDNDLNVLSRCMRRILGENVREISRLLGKNKCKSSKYRMQNKQSQSCGRYVISRIQCLKIGFNNDEYHDYLDELRQKYNIDYDLVVCLLVPIPRIKD